MTSTPYGSSNEDDKWEKIGEEIYTYVQKMAGDENAPKITGMIIDLPMEELEKSVATWKEFEEKVREGMDLLKEDQN